MAKLDREAQERSEHEAQERSDREAKERSDREVQERSEREARALLEGPYNTFEVFERLRRVRVDRLTAAARLHYR